MPREVDLKYLYSPEYRTALADTATISFFDDGIVPQMSLTFSRLESRALSEKATEIEPGKLAIRGGQTPAAEIMRHVEFQVLLRPDHAKNLADAIRKALVNMSPTERQRFGITDADVGGK